MDALVKRIKFKHLRGIVDGKPDYPSIMTEVLGYNNNWLGRRLVFSWKFKQSLSLVQSLKDVDISKIELEGDCSIRRPHNIDSISFRAMMETESLLGGAKHELHLVDKICELVAIVCFQANHKGSKYDSESFAFKHFKNRLMESSLFEVMGIYNWIDKALQDSHEAWNKRFLQVHVDDRDFQTAGGHMMGSFQYCGDLKNHL